MKNIENLNLQIQIEHTKNERLQEEIEQVREEYRTTLSAQLEEFKTAKDNDMCTFLMEHVEFDLKEINTYAGKLTERDIEIGNLKEVKSNYEKKN